MVPTRSPVLSTRALSRATLARQLLLERHAIGALEAVEQLVGLQGQAPDAPYVALWSRLAGFSPASLALAVAERAAVRVPLMRATVHLASARDALRLRAATQIVLERGFGGQAFGKQLAGIDMDALLATGRALLEERPRTRAELRPLLLERWPERDGDALAYAISYLLPTVQVPPRGVWGERGPAALAPLDGWLGAPLAPALAAGAPELDELVLRYLGAFGPASVKDAQTWCGLTRLREVFERLRPRLVTFRDEGGRELFDLPDAPRPDPGTPAPPRFLAEYDNVLLSHADRARVIEHRRRVPLPPGNGGAAGTVLVDGFMRADWRITRARDDGGTATLVLTPHAPLTRAQRDEVAAEGERLLTFAAAEAAARDVRIALPPD